ncbi:gliding motility-associated C-terminal domain-containing protein [Flammeovirga sp. EKP202]|uniref:T9SS type B sorting domain-containing protein n=1 Tax=Flammeovirga sp. EKP202 TaxID=2770592 RepID=UPI00165F8668|nr:gliding motility-associated C-terminal domain-containing protein [Flammeovirga sp. EKP202]MBD0402467.1 gliding motility-associated C-terminal domain-containing protein [Flammeovirga sp. EKP202]
MNLQTYKQVSFVLILLSISFLFQTQALATHIRAGDLTMRRVNEVSLTYEVTVILYRDVTGVQAGEGTISFGDGTDNAIVSPEELGFTQDGETQIIRYRVSHTFPSSGSYKVSYFERNRNPGVRNMDISSETPFFIQSEFFINPVLGLNSSPFLLIPPVIKGAVGQKFVHNAGAYDVDGDSLSYRLTVCLQGEDTPVQNYRFPDDPNEEWSRETEDCEVPPVFYIDEITGDLVWNAPFVFGEYNIAFLVEEWRDGIRIGAVNRDMQVIITDPLNLRPLIETPPDTCVIAGTELSKIIFAEDQDTEPCYNPDSTVEWGPHPIDFKIAQKDVDISPYVDMGFDVNYYGLNNSKADGAFSWTPTCDDIRSAPYQITFEAVDQTSAGNTDLGTLENWNVHVLGPPPLGLTANPPTSDELQRYDNKVTLSWDAYECSNAREIYIYRKVGSFDYEPSCETGLPNWTGYQYVGQVDASQNTYIDRNVEQGVTYCYRIYAVFQPPQGGESVASSEACAFIPDSQYIVNTDVNETGLDDGEILVRWTKPMDVADLSSVQYNIYRADGEEKAEDSEYLKLNGSPLGVNDTTFTDRLLNNVSIHYHYRIELLENGSPSDTTYIANFVKLSASSGIDFVDLSWGGTVPWNLTPDSVMLASGLTVGVYHYIYRKVEGDEPDYSLYDSVYVNTEGLRYTDNGTALEPLDDRKLYSYYVSTVGSYQQPIIAEPLINKTQELTVELLDTIPPCPPILTLKNYDDGVILNDPNDCNVTPFRDGERTCAKDRFSVELTWENQLGNGCDEDIVKYNIYFTPREAINKLDFGAPVMTIDHPADRELSEGYFYEFLNREFVSGSYAVTALDNSGNESALSNIIVQDNCPYYELPNAFSPNGDGINDTFIPMRCPRFVKTVKFSVINRWGSVIYEYNSDEHSGDIEINWDGKTEGGNLFEPGNYYYEAELTNYRLNSGDEEVKIKGSFVILRGKDQAGK